jgi:PAS domain S-box-containing protein
MDNKQPNTKTLQNYYIPTAEFYSQIIDSLYDYSIFTLDTALNINSWSVGSSRIFGYETEETLGKPFDMIFTEDDKQKGEPAIEITTALQKGRAADNKWHIRKDGSTFYASGLVFPLIGMEGEMLGYVKILRDLTEKKKSEEAMQKYVKELEDLNMHKESVLDMLSHDLRSPLSRIIGIAQFLSSSFEQLPENEVKEMLGILHKSSQDELDMLDYLVEWSRIKYASEAFAPTKIELLSYVEKVFDILNETATVNTIHLHHQIEENTSVFADGRMLLSVLRNIVSNALKHTHQGGKISISAQKKENKVIVEVKDTGVGMSEEIQKKLFIPQMRSLSKTQKENAGVGIGLFLVKGLLEKNGGEIWVESIEGVGSSFYFTLPIDEPLQKANSPQDI